MKQDINLDLNQCVKEISNIGSTTYQNICNGSLVIVPWGSSDWMSCIFTILVVVGTGYLGYKIAKEVLSEW